MGKIFKNMIPYWKPLILVLLLLFVQAWCDLLLPAYTSDSIDVGIQNQGIKHILPEALTPEEYEKAELLMTDEETASWEESYALNGGNSMAVCMGSTRRGFTGESCSILCPITSAQRIHSVRTSITSWDSRRRWAA